MIRIGFFLSKNIDLKLFWIPKNLRSKNYLVLNMFGLMKLDPKLFYHKTTLGSKKLGPEKIRSKKMFGRKSLVQNLLSNSWDIAKHDKCRQVTYCLDKFHHDSWHLLQMVPESWLWSLVKIGFVTAEILLIWTNVARTNVAWTNVHINCLRLSRVNG